MIEQKRIYSRMMKIFIEHTSNDEFYDVDMFRADIKKELFTYTGSQEDIDDDNHLMFSEALILLVRDDLLLDYYGLSGLSILHADLLMDYAFPGGMFNE